MSLISSVVKKLVRVKAHASKNVQNEGVGKMEVKIYFLAIRGINRLKVLAYLYMLMVFFYENIVSLLLLR